MLARVGSDLANALAITDFMHSHMLPFSLTECPKFLKLLNTAKSLGTGYLPPDRRKMSGLLLDMRYDTNKEEMIKNLLLESKIFGVTIFGDGSTITNIPLMNILAASPNNPFALLEIVDCTDQMAKGGKKDATYLAGIVRPLIKWLEARAKSNIVDLIMFDGASNVQLAGKLWQDIILVTQEVRQKCRRRYTHYCKNGAH